MVVSVEILVIFFGAAFLAGAFFGMLLARELRIYREATRRGGELDLTGRRP
jgi:hypothetical protein